MQPQSEGDCLNLTQQPNIISQLRQKQQIKFSTLIKKINEEKMIQQRIFLLTNEAIYNISKRSSLIKSLVSKLITLQSKYTIKRKIPLKQLYGITLSKSKQNGEFVINVIDNYDYRYCTQNHEKKVLLLKKICEVYTLNTSKKLPFYFKDEIVLIEYATRKCDLKIKIDRKPKDDPVFLGCEDFQEYELPDLDYKLQFCADVSNDAITMKSFRPIFEIQQLQNNQQYFTVTTSQLELKNIMQLMTINSKYLIRPEFIFSTKSKLQLITPFMIGGNLARKLKKCVRISNQLAYFYIAELILCLEDLMENNIEYGNFCLENVFINQNGYLRLLGVDKDLKILTGENQYQKLKYDIVGNLNYIPPETILVKGYNFRANLWKLGVCAYYLLLGTFPFEGNNPKKIYHQILTKKPKQQIPDFLHKLLERDPKKRITIEELKKDPKFVHINWKKLKEESLLAPYLPDTSSWRGNLPSIVCLKQPL